MFQQLKLFVLCVAFCAIILFVSVIFLSNNDIFYMVSGMMNRKILSPRFN